MDCPAAQVPVPEKVQRFACDLLRVTFKRPHAWAAVILEGLMVLGGALARDSNARVRIRMRRNPKWSQNSKMVPKWLSQNGPKMVTK